jgi:hypothetical protein
MPPKGVCQAVRVRQIAHPPEANKKLGRPAEDPGGDLEPGLTPSGQVPEFSFSFTSNGPEQPVRCIGARGGQGEAGKCQKHGPSPRRIRFAATGTPWPVRAYSELCQQTILSGSLIYEGRPLIRYNFAVYDQRKPSRVAAPVDLFS